MTSTPSEYSKLVIVGTITAICQLLVPSPSSRKNLVPPVSPVDRIAVPSASADCQLLVPSPSSLKNLLPPVSPVEIIAVPSTSVASKVDRATIWITSSAEKADRPVIFDCLVDKEENCFPMIPSGKPHNQMLLGPKDQKENKITKTTDNTFMLVPDDEERNN